MKEPVQGDAARTRTFPRSVRLLKHADFDNAYQNGRRYFSPLMSVFYLDRRKSEDHRQNQNHGLQNDARQNDARRSGRPGDQTHGPRVGLTVGRVLGGAVQRNRIKRRMRAMIREHLHLLVPAVDVVINPKRQVLQVEAPRLSEEVRKAFVAIVKQIDEPASAAPQGRRRAEKAEGK